MSKEKNLTFERQKLDSIHKYWINAYGHEIDSGRTYHYFSGPAIDRLHEFENLGMEPEEIEDMIARQAKIMSDKLYAESENNLLAKVNRDLTDSHLKLIGKNKSQAVTIRNLTEENDELRQQIKFLEETIDKFSVEESKRKIDELKHELGKKELFLDMQRDAISERDREIGRLKKSNIHMNNVRARNGELYRETLTLNTEVKDLEKIVKNQSIEISDLKGKLQDKRKQLDSYKAENSLMGELLKKHGIVILRGYVED